MNNNNGPFILCWKRSTASLDIEINDEHQALFAGNMDALNTLVDKKVEGLIMRHFLITTQSGVRSPPTLPASMTGGITHVGGSYRYNDRTSDLSYEDSLIELCILTFGNLIRVLTPSDEGVLVDAFKPMERAPRIRKTWEKDPNDPGSYRQISKSKETVFQQILRRAKPGTVMKLIVDRCRVVSAKLRPTETSIK